MKTLRNLTIALTLAALSVLQTAGAAVPTFANLNRVYFAVNTSPTATISNVVLLTGNLTNWQKLSTNVLVITVPVNPTSGRLTMNIGGMFADSPLYTNGVLVVMSNASVSPYPGYHIITGGGDAQFLAGGNLANIRGSAGVDLMDALAAGNEIRFAFKKWFPVQSGTWLGGTNPVGGVHPYAGLVLGTNTALAEYTDDGSQPLRNGVPIPMSTSTNQWTLLSVAEGATTNVTFSFNGKTYTMQAW